VSFPFDLHSAAVSDSHLPCHAPTMPFFSRPQHGRSMAWAWQVWIRRGRTV